MVKYREHPPHPSLQGFVRCFWTMEREYTPLSPSEDVTPDACIELIFNFGAPYRQIVGGAAGPELPRAIVVGLQKKPLLFRCQGTVRIVATRFYAWGALPFLAGSSDRRGPLQTTLDREWADLAARVRPAVGADDYEAAVSIVQDHLVGKLRTMTVDLRRVRGAAAMLHLERGRFRLAELAERSSLSGRQLQRQFQDVIGMSPKALARVIRFEEIRKRLMFDPNQSLTSLAHEFEYADQAHFIRDFKQFADRTPGEFARQMRAIQKILRDDGNVAFLQVPPAARR